MFSAKSRRSRTLRVGCEALEGRDLQAVAFHAPGRVMLNPQPLPPQSILVASANRVMLNPQPLPPRY